jgi:membrane-bound inhibitor of C-type lysozyme
MSGPKTLNLCHWQSVNNRLVFLLPRRKTPMKAFTQNVASLTGKGFAGMVVLAAVVSSLGCSSQPSQPSSPNLPPPRPIVVAPPAPTQPTIPSVTPQPQVVTQQPVQSAPIATTTVPSATMSIDTGLYRCELGVRVTVKKIAPDKSSLVLNWKNKDYTLTSVSSQSGALRFEDKANGLVWMAIVGKSQLLNSKLGQRLANDCNL